MRRPFAFLSVVLLLFVACVVSAWSGVVHTSTFGDDVISAQDDWSQLRSHAYAGAAIAATWAAWRRLPWGWHERRWVLVVLVAFALILPRYTGSALLKAYDERTTIRDTFDPRVVELLPTPTPTPPVAR